ncbi:MAG: hypothetical protein ABL891_14650 [Burkholderiales bacterium]
MEYGLTRLAIGSKTVVPITKKEYSDLASAKVGLLNALFLEEKFDLVAENFLELETELLSSTARYMLHGKSNYNWFQFERNLINRRLLNLLSICRGYLDFARPFGKNILTEDSNAVAKFDTQFRTYYDTVLGYRVMEAMRNHVQHSGFPIHVLQYHEKINKQQSRNRIPCEIAIFTKTSYLKEDGMFKASVLAELEKLGGRVDVKPLFRDYVACLAATHEQLREIQKSLNESAEEKFNVLIARYKSAYSTEPPLDGLAAVKVDGYVHTDQIMMFPGFIKYRKHLESKNSSFGNFANRYVTGQVMDPNT